VYRPSENVSNEAAQREFQRISAVFARLAQGLIRRLYVAPAKPQDGETAICDGTSWDPLGDGLSQPVWYDGEAGIWKALSGLSGFSGAFLLDDGTAAADGVFMFDDGVA
jgi:hypothetical protein